MDGKCRSSARTDGNGWWGFWVAASDGVSEGHLCAITSTERFITEEVE